MNNIDKIFARCRQENRKCLIMFTVCGCPTLAQSEEIIEGMIQSGADIIELGVPFSDPMADGPVIEHASHVALCSHTKYQDILAMARRIKQRHPDTGLVLFSYYNLLLFHNFDFDSNAVDAILAVDLPYEESDELNQICLNRNIALIPLIAPSTPIDRIKLITQNSKGFIYSVNFCGVTGTENDFFTAAAQQLENIKNVSSLPVAAGFGIKNAEDARKLTPHADAIIVGSAAVKLATTENAVNKIKTLTSSLRQALANDKIME